MSTIEHLAPSTSAGHQAGEAARAEEVALERDLASSAVRPIIPGFFPDPTICRKGEDYYLATSSFEYFPGAPIFHSRDLTTWEQIGNILTTRDQFRRGTTGPSTGIYGSTLRYHGGRFWFITTNVSDFESGQVIVHAEDPAGPWSDPVFVPEAQGIDPDLCWDADGQCYLTWHLLDFTVGGQGIRQAPIDPETGTFLEPDYPIWQGSGMQAAEGPHLHRIGSYWYLLLAEGGTERGHCVTVARGTSPRGPFEGDPRNPVFTHRSSSHSVQNVGHADLVPTPTGEWAAVYLGARPRGSTPGFHVLGRETFLAGIDWVDGWPVFEEDRFRIPAAETAFHDDFTSEQLDPRWVVPDGEPESLVVSTAAGLAFRSSEATADHLCCRVRDFSWRAEANVSISGSFGLRLDDRHWCELVLDDDRVRVIVRIGDLRQETESVPVVGGDVVLVLETAEPKTRPVPFGYAGPDDVVLSVRSGGVSTELARLDGRYFSTEVAAGFTGRTLAVSSHSPEGRIRSISYSPATDLEHRGS
ncbi:glycoside hydrolase family 43 protein [Rathayibacter festucae]|uniref:glycoside hydrolase family 43 protein n=1 Tax=Rathayibacter festucae TaxID=110937 RepID=UPI002A6A5E65|nr:family 43 glycosylhydrolase [Rathayibacter festucae]MDY0914578.1 family 43 glycosylhydrolase [Rathayibacter festucae]